MPSLDNEWNKKRNKQERKNIKVGNIKEKKSNVQMDKNRKDKYRNFLLIWMSRE